MAKKRPTLDAFLTTETQSEGKSEEGSGTSDSTTAGTSKTRLDSTKKDIIPNSLETSKRTKKDEVIRHMLYLPVPVYDQLQGLIFEEQRGQIKRRKTHDYLLDAIDLLFRKKGLKSIRDLTGKK